MKIFKVTYIKEETTQRPLSFETWVYGDEATAEQKKQSIVNNIIEDYEASIMDDGQADDALITLVNESREYFTVALDYDILY